MVDFDSLWPRGLFPDPGGRSRIPGLISKGTSSHETIVEDNQGKERIFREAFFPPPPVESKVPTNVEYPEPKWTFAPPTGRQIYNAIGRMKNGKATRSGTFSNDFLKACRDVIVPYLGVLYRASFELAIYPEEWSLNETIVLRKLGKSDYRQAGAWRPDITTWRPIVLSDGLGQLLNSIMAEEITKQAELLGLLPAMQFG
ncbi:hypothetical protein K435DRAFT_658143, partial [Dendrothele bispora CBS 962.96]